MQNDNTLSTELIQLLLVIIINAKVKCTESFDYSKLYLWGLWNERLSLNMYRSFSCGTTNLSWSWSQANFIFFSKINMYVCMCACMSMRGKFIPESVIARCTVFTVWRPVFHSVLQYVFTMAPWLQFAAITLWHSRFHCNTLCWQFNVLWLQLSPFRLQLGALWLQLDDQLFELGQFTLPSMTVNVLCFFAW